MPPHITPVDGPTTINMHRAYLQEKPIELTIVLTTIAKRTDPQTAFDRQARKIGRS